MYLVRCLPKQRSKMSPTWAQLGPNLAQLGPTGARMECCLGFYTVKHSRACQHFTSLGHVLETPITYRDMRLKRETTMTSSYEFRDVILQLFRISSQLNVKIILNKIFSQVAISFPLVMRPFHEATKHVQRIKGFRYRK